MTGFASKWLTWAPVETPIGGTDNTAKSLPISPERDDIAAGPNRARGKTGALQNNLRRLHKLFGGA